MTREDAEKTFDWTLEDWRATDGAERIPLLSALLEEKWEEYDQVDAIRALAWGFKSTSLKDFNNSIKPEEYLKHYRNTLFDWLKICVSSKPEEGYYFTTCILKGKHGNAQHILDRELCIRELIKDGDDLDRFFYSPDTTELDKEGELHLRFLITWFIRRYDLCTAWWLIRKLAQHLPSNKAKEENLDLKTSCRWYCWRFLLFLGVFLIALLPVLLGHDLPPFFMVPQITGPSQIAQSLLYRTWYKLVQGFLFIFFLAISYLVHSKYSTQLLQLFIPRLGACIMVGYFPLIITDEVWQASALFFAWESWWPPPSVIVIAVLSLGASFVYLLIEVKNKVIERQLAWRRAINIFLIGLCWSLIIGLVILGLVGPAFKSRLDILNSLLWVPGLLGDIPVQVLLLYMPLALLIGIFLQIIWEEKPITEPL
ncbi:MAG: hypothetical protein PHW74_10460 [Desulfobacca sp.]|nr:hypothetical protein [Desulfobacca sp.]